MGIFFSTSGCPKYSPLQNSACCARRWRRSSNRLTYATRPNKRKTHGSAVVFTRFCWVASGAQLAFRAKRDMFIVFSGCMAYLSCAPAPREPLARNGTRTRSLSQMNGPIKTLKSFVKHRVTASNLHTPSRLTSPSTVLEDKDDRGNIGFAQNKCTTDCLHIEKWRRRAVVEFVSQIVLNGLIQQ